VKLRLDEIVEHPDADLVLRTLEHYLREVSIETVRTEEELIVYGLGPSFRTMNPRDKTTVRAISHPSATTMLHTEADFLASALAGDTAQDEIVRAKIERAFESLKTELSYGTASRATAAWTLPHVEPATPSPVVEVVPAIAKAGTPTPVEVKEASPVPIESAPDAVRAPIFEAKPQPQPPPETTPKPQPNPQPNPKIEVKPEPRVEPKPAPKIDEPVLATPRRSAPVPSAVTMEAVPIKKRRSAILLVLPLLILLLAAVFYMLQHPRASQSLVAAKAEGHTASASTENKAAVPAPAPAPAPAPPSSAVTPAPPAPAAMPTNIRAWVQAWAAAISTRDVQTQLGLYATPLNRYFLTPNVSREQLLKNKQAEIDDRKGVWTMRAENVVVQKRTSTNAVVFLTKHITVKLLSSTIREERIKAQLKLKMVDGQWKITSERTVG
jgi:ketosteroid isomerase-like protein